MVLATCTHVLPQNVAIKCSECRFWFDNQICKFATPIKAIKCDRLRKMVFLVSMVMSTWQRCAQHVCKPQLCVVVCVRVAGCANVVCQRINMSHNRRSRYAYDTCDARFMRMWFLYTVLEMGIDCIERKMQYFSKKLFDIQCI